mmetsp:Transcript_62025/g.101420  ORF Transcript_62025/g.101420 Transcript_62025/m.101420 type:complete len:83 (-) Transcript_62025:277-525(-)
MSHCDWPKDFLAAEQGLAAVQSKALNASSEIEKKRLKGFSLHHRRCWDEALHTNHRCAHLLSQATGALPVPNELEAAPAART